MHEVGARLAAIARSAVAAHVAGERFAEPSAGPPAPVFVTIRGADGALRGCIGTLTAAEASVSEETARNAVLAASRDPRFPALTSQELPGVSFEVSVLLDEEPIASPEELDPSQFGVVVRDDAGRRGVLLPDVPGVETAEQQVAIACRKAGIPEPRGAQLARFRVLKYAE